MCVIIENLSTELSSEAASNQKRIATGRDQIVFGETYLAYYALTSLSNATATRTEGGGSTFIEHAVRMMTRTELRRTTVPGTSTVPP